MSCNCHSEHCNVSSINVKEIRNKKRSLSSEQKIMIGRIAGSIILLITAVLIDHFAEVNMVHIPFWLNLVMYLIPYFLIGYDILKEAIENIFHGKMFDENFLMSVATIGALVLGEYPEAVFVMLFSQVGELFEEYATDKSRASIAEMMDIRPDSANVIRNGNTETVNPEDVKIGEIIVVKPGEKIPLDGIVIEGNSTLDTSALTGESVPRDALVGNTCISGCVNLSGLLKIEVTKEFGDSTVSKILNLVDNASSKKDKVENFITKFAKVYTPIVVFSALA